MPEQGDTILVSIPFLHQCEYGNFFRAYFYTN